jgi:Tfp pilus assembly protein PilF
LGFVLARAASMSSEETLSWTDVVKWSESAASSDPKAWYMHAAGLANLRAGQFDKAKEWLDKSAATTWHPELNHLALSLVHARQGNADLAREQFQNAQDWLKQVEAEKRDGYYAVQDTDWLEFQIILREAVNLLK